MHAQFPAAAVAHIDTIILLCQFHASKLPAHAAHKVRYFTRPATEHH